MSEEDILPSEIRGLLIPLEGDQLLLPNAAVAELIDYREPQKGARDSDWYQGVISWRQRTLPVISLEPLMNRPLSGSSQRKRIVVCHTLGDAAKRPFLGIVANAIPRLVRIREENIVPIAQQSEGESDWLILARLEVDGEAAAIPDLSGLEQRVREMM